jgi:CRISPR-associated protein Cas2
MKKFYVISYDISDNRKRAKAANILKDYGWRVQKSVFECRLRPDTLNELLKRLEKIIEPETDSLLIYVLCKACVQQKAFRGFQPTDMDKDFCVR